MRTIIAYLVLVTTTLFACTGDCLTCHPTLLATIQDDERHKPMLTCIECHSADPESMSECGSDCFACHPVEKIEKVDVKAHMTIRACRDCHLKLEKALISIKPKSGQSHQQTLKELLLD